MPHVIVEYTANLNPDARIPELLKGINDALIAQGDAFPIGGIRSRAIELRHYRMADGSADYAFVHVTLKIGSGRTPETKKRAGDALFELLKAHFAEVYAKRLFALSMELCELEGVTYKYNNVHAHLRRIGSGV